MDQKWWNTSAKKNSFLFVTYKPFSVFIWRLWFADLRAQITSLTRDWAQFNFTSLTCWDCLANNSITIQCKSWSKGKPTTHLILVIISNLKRMTNCFFESISYFYFLISKRNNQTRIKRFRIAFVNNFRSRPNSHFKARTNVANF